MFLAKKVALAGSCGATSLSTSQNHPVKVLNKCVATNTAIPGIEDNLPLLSLHSYLKIHLIFHCFRILLSNYCFIRSFQTVCISRISSIQIDLEQSSKQKLITYKNRYGRRKRILACFPCHNLVLFKSVRQIDIENFVFKVCVSYFFGLVNNIFRALRWTITIPCFCKES